MSDTDQLREELLDFYRDRLWPTPQDAEDFVQRTFEKFLSKTDVQSARTLLFHIAKDLLKNEYRDRESRPETVSWEQLIGDGEQLDHLPQFQTYDFEDSTFASALDAAVRVLDPAPRDAFILGELRGLPSREIAPLVGTSHVTANVRRESATAIVRKEITQ